MNRAVLQYDLEGNFIKEYYSQAQAQRETGIRSKDISRVCTGNRHTASGYIWKYKNE